MADKNDVRKNESLVLERMDDPEKLREILVGMRHEDVAELVESIDKDKRLKILAAFDSEAASEIILDMNENVRDQILEKMSINQISDVVEEMDSDDAADIVSELPEHHAEKVLATLPESESMEIRELLRYPEESAGGIMQLELISLSEEHSCQDAIEIIRSKSEEVESLHYVYVVDADNRFVGVVSLRRLLLHSLDTKIKSIMSTHPVAVNVMDDVEKVARVFRKYDLVAIGVIDEGRRLLGRILHDDILDVITEIDTEDMLKMAGTDEEEFDSQSWLSAARYRLPWLLSSMVGGVLMAGIIGAMGTPMKQVIALAAFIPVITGMSGNVSTQSSAVALRGIALGRIDAGRIKSFVLKEMRVGIVMAISCGTLMGIAAFVINENPIMGAIVGLALLISMAFASVLGTSIPLILDGLKADPALGAGPIILTLVDISALVIYFGIARTLLNLLG
ncbi:MAG: magnesium transporter [Nitrospinota bacterium]